MFLSLTVVVVPVMIDAEAVEQMVMLVLLIAVPVVCLFSPSYSLD